MRNKIDQSTTSILFIGHLAIDSIVRFKKTHKPTIGGTVSFGSLALRKYNKDVKIGIISNLGELNFKKELLKSFDNKDIDLRGLKWSNTNNTNFVLDYFNHNRTLTLKSRSPNLKFEDIPEYFYHNSPQVIVLAPLCNEISYEYVSKIIKKFPEAYIGIDLQGFIRYIDDNGIVSYIHDEEIISNMRNVINLIADRLILKGSEIEMKLLSGCDDFYDVMECFNQFGTGGIFIMTLGEAGSMIIKKEEKLLEIPAFKAKEVVDETGAGDVYLAIFLYEFIKSNMNWQNVERAAHLASAAASFLVEKKGPAGFKEKSKVIKRVLNKNYIT
ncbi:MAG: PfkB family carbohydrate kinase [Candidatus Hodarchaeota archaeon]